MLINLTNHPSTFWDEPQLQAAAEYGEVVDMPFPAIDAKSDEASIETLVNEYFEKISELAKNNRITVHIMGEMTFCFGLISGLSRLGIDCIASTSVRDVVNTDNGQKQVNFNFVRFRKYNL
jgi:uncharacterized protein (DUF4213/DUF364 family)